MSHHSPNSAHPSGGRRTYLATGSGVVTGSSTGNRHRKQQSSSSGSSPVGSNRSVAFEDQDPLLPPKKYTHQPSPHSGGMHYHTQGGHHGSPQGYPQGTGMGRGPSTGNQQAKASPKMANGKHRPNFAMPNQSKTIF